MLSPGWVPHCQCLEGVDVSIIESRMAEYRQLLKDMLASNLVISKRLRTCVGTPKHRRFLQVWWPFMSMLWAALIPVLPMRIVVLSPLSLSITPRKDDCQDDSMHGAEDKPPPAKDVFVSFSNQHAHRLCPKFVCNGLRSLVLACRRKTPVGG